MEREKERDRWKELLVDAIGVRCTERDVNKVDIFASSFGDKLSLKFSVEVVRFRGDR